MEAELIILLEETVQIGEPGSPSTRRDEYFLFLLEEIAQIGEPGSPSTRRDEYFLFLLEETANRRTWKPIYPT